MFPPIDLPRFPIIQFGKGNRAACAKSVNLGVKCVSPWFCDARSALPRVLSEIEQSSAE